MTTQWGQAQLNFYKLINSDIRIIEIVSKLKAVEQVKERLITAKSCE